MKSISIAQTAKGEERIERSQLTQKSQQTKGDRLYFWSPRGRESLEVKLSMRLSKGSKVVKCNTFRIYDGHWLKIIQTLFRQTMKSCVRQRLDRRASGQTTESGVECSVCVFVLVIQIPPSRLGLASFRTALRRVRFVLEPFRFLMMFVLFCFCFRSVRSVFLTIPNSRSVTARFYDLFRGSISREGFWTFFLTLGLIIFFV